ncbi:MAG: helix-turn-helix transcriptional regulator [Bacteroidota bacterium]
MIRLDWVTFFASLGTMHGVFFAIIIWLRKNKNVSSHLFSLLLIVTSIRIAKNILVHARQLDPEFAMSHELWWSLVHIGILHQFAIGPLFLLYFQSRVNPNFSLKRDHTWHFAPYVILLVLTPWLKWPFWRDGGLFFSYAHILAYYILAFRTYVQANNKRRTGEKAVESDTLKWLKTLSIIGGLLMIAYFPSLFKYLGYIGGAFLYSLGIYFVSTLLLRDRKWHLPVTPKYQTSSINKTQSKRLKDQLEELMNKDQLFTDPDISLSRVAKLMDVPSAHISRAINEHTGTNFSDYINQLRIALAKTRLSDPAFHHLKISSIAYDVGFGALSTFNTLFKKYVGETPSAYRKRFET